MPKEIRLKPLERVLGKLPAKLPFEGTIDSALDKVGQKIENSTLRKKLERVHEKLPIVPGINMNTPFGGVKLPELSLPKPSLPQMDDRRKEAMKAAAVIDASFLVSLIPVVGDAVADNIEDTYGEKIRETLNGDELTTYMKYDRMGPSVLAMWRALTK